MQTYFPVQENARSNSIRYFTRKISNKRELH